jgi:hypothetical protein
MQNDTLHPRALQRITRYRELRDTHPRSEEQNEEYHSILDRLVGQLFSRIYYNRNIMGNIVTNMETDRDFVADLGHGFNLRTREEWVEFYIDDQPLVNITVEYRSLQELYEDVMQYYMENISG